MKKALLVVIGLTMSYYSMAQETVKQKEIGLVFSDLNSFGLTFRTGTDKTLWRFNTLHISGDNRDNSSDSLINKQRHLEFGLKLGKEYRKYLVDNLEFRYGADISFKYSQYKYEDEDNRVNNNNYRFFERTTYGPGINLVFGFNYLLSDNFVIGAELLPSFTYITGTSTDKYNDRKEVKSDISGFEYGLSNTSVLLSFAYRF